LPARWAKVVENNGDYIVDWCCISLLKNKVIVKPEKKHSELMRRCNICEWIATFWYSCGFACIFLIIFFVINWFRQFFHMLFLLECLTATQNSSSLCHTVADLWALQLEKIVLFSEACWKSEIS
jgi:hypothetical protein